MTDKPTSTAPVLAPEPLVPHGHTLLAQAREAAGLPLDALSLALKVPVKRLESLEAGRYDELPDMTFARALAMSICRHLQLDAQMVLERMPPAHMTNLGVKVVVSGDAMYTNGEGLALSPVGVLRRPSVLMVLALIIAAALLYSLPELPVQVPAQSPVVEALKPVPAPSPEPEVQPATVSLPIAAPLADALPAAPVAPTRSVILRVSAQEETWFEVIRPDGTVLMSRLLQSGDVVDSGLAPPYTVVLGRASAAQVFVRGEAIALAPHTRGDVARYEVK